MGALAAGQVVILPFPFSDLSGHKFRPALLLAGTANGDWIACQITSNPFSDPLAIEIAQSDFADGGLRRTSFARPGKLFTANEAIFAESVGMLHSIHFNRIREAVISIFR